MSVFDSMGARHRPAGVAPGGRAGASGHRPGHWLLLALLALVVWLLPGPTQAQATGADGQPAARPVLTVQFVHPERYTDAGDAPGGAADPELLALLQRELERSAAPCLAPGQALAIRVLDVDLAGDIDRLRWRGIDSVRVLRERASPRIELAYTLTQAGQPGSEVSEVVVDRGFLMRVAPGRYADDRLPHERAMLARWFTERFCPGAAVH